MKNQHHHRLASLVAGLVALCAQASAADAPAAPASFQDALTHGKLSASARLRYERVEQDGVANNADALTARLRAAYTTQAFKGFQASIEGEAVTPLVNNYFDGTGANANGFPVVADPEVYNVNQAWLAYTHEQTKASLGRQKLVLDNARFVGDVGWRQNDQTFDSLVLQDKSFEKTTLTYAYLDRVNRVFDDSGAQPDWDSNSHVLHGAYAGLPIGTLSGYGYLLDFNADNGNIGGLAGARAASCQTYGASLVGSRPVTKEIKALYRLEYAFQSDYGDNAADYVADYYLAELGAGLGGHSLSVGHEVLGSDDGLAGFRTPLATLHAHNGWADVFLGTPAVGLTDTYVKGVAALPGSVTLTAFYHVFGTDEGAAQIGREADLMATYKLNKQLSFTAKAAKYYSDEAAVPGLASNADRTKFWLQADYAY